MPVPKYVKPPPDGFSSMVRLAKEQGLSLTGPDGLLKQLTKTVLEISLNEEMTEHLGYEKRDPAGAGTGNVRNRTIGKTVLTEHSGSVEVDVPRDRAGTFTPQIVRKRQRRLSGVDEVVLSVRRGRSRGRRYGVSSSSVQSAGIHRLRSTHGAPNPRLLNLNKATKRHFASSWP